MLVLCKPASVWKKCIITPVLAFSLSLTQGGRNQVSHKYKLAHLHGQHPSLSSDPQVYFNSQILKEKKNHKHLYLWPVSSMKIESYFSKFHVRFHHFTASTCPSSHQGETFYFLVTSFRSSVLLDTDLRKG